MKKSCAYVVFVLVFFWLNAGPGICIDGPHNSGVFEKVDELFAPWDNSQSPGCALAVVKEGKIIYKQGYGMADLEQGHRLWVTVVRWADTGLITCGSLNSVFRLLF